MRDFLIAAAVVALILIGGAVRDYLSRSQQQAECERDGGVYVVGVSDIVCVAKLSERRS